MVGVFLPNESAGSVSTQEAAAPIMFSFRFFFSYVRSRRIIFVSLCQQVIPRPSQKNCSQRVAFRTSKGKKRLSSVLGPIISEPIPILGSPHAKVPSKIPSKVPAVRPSYWLTFLTFICDWLSHSSEPICALLNQ